MVDSANSADTQINRPTSNIGILKKVPLVSDDAYVQINDLIPYYEVVKEVAKDETLILANVRYIADMLLRGPLYDGFSFSQKRYVGQIINNIIHYYLAFLLNKNYLQDLLAQLDKIRYFFEDFNCKGDEFSFNVCCVENIVICIDNIANLLNLSKATNEQ